MKTYKDFEKKCIGSSDYACLIAAGNTENGIKSTVIKFGEDGCYSAYIVTEPAEIGSHYEKIASFKSWLKIYDDEGLYFEISGKKINIYRAKEMGCIIEVLG